jgi:hypothetical protein
MRVDIREAVNGVIQTGVGLAAADGIVEGQMTAYGCVGGDVEWVCSQGPTNVLTNAKYLPSTCRLANASVVRPATCVLPVP